LSPTSCSLIESRKHRTDKRLLLLNAQAAVRGGDYLKISAPSPALGAVGKARHDEVRATQGLNWQMLQTQSAAERPCKMAITGGVKSIV